MVEKMTDAATELPLAFATQQLVLIYLKGKGFKVEKSALSNHVRARLLAKKPEGFRLRDVDKYAELHLKDTATGMDAADKRTVDLQERKLRAEIHRTEEQAAKAKIEREMMEGKLINREDVELEMAGRAVVLEAGFDHMVYTRSAEIIELTGGDVQLVDRMIALLMEAKCKWFNQYATTDTFMVTIKRDA
ncbi:MAG: hypothetical protein J0652_02660 [Desulfobulbaceae bacterium]|jgi:phage terminase Nu1 subunit (DNA packaging protein)|nr:hypothetical protein [Desulfobulbaceae bacterium]